MLKNIKVVFLFFNFFLTFFVFSEIHANNLESNIQQEAELEIALEDLKEESATFVQASNVITKAWSEFLKSVSEVRNTWFTINKSSDKYDKSSDKYNKSEVEINQALSIYNKSWDEKNSAFDEYSQSWETIKELNGNTEGYEYTEGWDKYIEARAEFLKTQSKSYKNWYSLVKAKDNSILNTKIVFSSEISRDSSAQNYFDSLNKSVITQKEINLSKSILWSKSIQLFEVLSQSIEVPANIFNIEDTQSLLKDCFRKYKKLASKSEKIISNLHLLNNKNIHLYEEMILNNEREQLSNSLLFQSSKAWDEYSKAWNEHKKSMDAIKKAGEIYDKAWVQYSKVWDAYSRSKFVDKKSSNEIKIYRDKHEKAWGLHEKAKDKYTKILDKNHKFKVKYDKASVKYTTIKDEVNKAWDELEIERVHILDNLNAFFEEIEKLDKLEKKLKNGLLLQTTKMFQNAILSLENEPRAQKIYQQSLIAYKALEAAYELIN